MSWLTTKMLPGTDGRACNGGREGKVSQKQAIYLNDFNNAMCESPDTCITITPV